jgi:hypothetical protein
MVAIDVDFEVFKRLTALRATESDTYNDVLRELLKLKPNGGAALPQTPPGGLTLKGVLFPDGTQFRATYKGKTYTAQVKGGAWIDSEGVQRNSPSEAASAITDTNVNGWTFWEARRPSDRSWRRLEQLRKS